jgi:hypothetical protein
MISRFAAVDTLLDHLFPSKKKLAAQEQNPRLCDGHSLARVRCDRRAPCVFVSTDARLTAATVSFVQGKPQQNTGGGGSPNSATATGSLDLTGTKSSLALPNFTHTVEHSNCQVAVEYKKRQVRLMFKRLHVREPEDT